MLKQTELVRGLKLKATTGTLVIESSVRGRGDFPDITFNLNIDDRHEKSYFESLTGGKKVLDHIIAETFIEDGDVVVDVGANVGFCSMVYIMNGASEVTAFEPHPEIFKRLQGLAHDKLMVSEYALSDSHGETKLILSSSHNQGHTMSGKTVSNFPRVFGDNPTTVTISQTPLDSVWRGGPIDFLKVDIEGFEVEFLKGARGILDDSPPRILHIEVYPSVFEETMNTLRLHYAYIKRCVVMDDTQKIKLISGRREPSTVDGADLQHPPTFICSNDEDIIRKHSVV